jgi:hypothetical protein
MCVNITKIAQCDVSGRVAYTAGGDGKSVGSVLLALSMMRVVMAIALMVA